MNDRNASYVRGQMLAAKSPPSNAIGPIKWMRENLFDGVISVFLTLGALAVIVWIVASLAPWVSNSIWNAGSLTECREILQGESGACWGVIRDRLPQLIFGFYPPEIYWRPVLALVLLVAAVSPILFPSVPRKMFWMSLAFPGIGYWLLWGGSMWFPVSIYAGAVIGALLFSVGSRFNLIVAVGLALAGAVFWWLELAAPAAVFVGGIMPVEILAVTSRDFGGFLISLTIGVTGIVLSLPLGILLALGRRSDMILIKTVSVVFIEFIRGVPLITLLFTASLLLNYFLPPGTTFDLILRVIIMVTLFATAYMAEVIRGGLAALPRGQYEAADALGLDYWKAQQLIIMPQALKISIPGIVNTFIGLFKDTTLVVFIGLLDPIGLASAIRANSDWQGIYWELFIFIGAVFWVFCFGMSRYSMYLEHRLKTDHR